MVRGVVRDGDEPGPARRAGAHGEERAEALPSELGGAADGGVEAERVGQPERAVGEPGRVLDVGRRVREVAHEPRRGGRAGRRLDRCRHVGTAGRREQHELRGGVLRAGGRVAAAQLGVRGEQVALDVGADLGRPGVRGHGAHDPIEAAGRTGQRGTGAAQVRRGAGAHAEQQEAGRQARPRQPGRGPDVRARQVHAHDLAGRAAEARAARPLGQLGEVHAVPHGGVDRAGARLQPVLRLARRRDGDHDRVGL